MMIKLNQILNANEFHFFVLEAIPEPKPIPSLDFDITYLDEVATCLFLTPLLRMPVKSA